jgi:hypothetical protein
MSESSKTTSPSLAEQVAEETPVPAPSAAEPVVPSPASPPGTAPQKPAPPPVAWSQFVRTAPAAAIAKRFAEEVKALVARHPAIVANYCCVQLLDATTTIDSYDLDQIFDALLEKNANREKNVLLVLLSGGGAVEPAYQISKMCKAFARDKFLVVVPRQAKSAATLLAIGADEIHMGPLAQLGPIDPQLGDLPALGVSQALESIARVSEKHPGSAEMFARYLRLALTVEQIGYCDRICEAAVQYAERLLLTKPQLQTAAPKIAKDLVYEYKHHGFVIDLEEAHKHLGRDWLRTDTPELAFAEDLYKRFDLVNLLLGLYVEKHLAWVGGVDAYPLVLDNPRR